MKARIFVLAAASAALAFAATPAFATRPVNPPTLHGFCSLAAPCTDNGVHTPTDVNPPEFAFASSGGAATGTLLIDILVPDNGGIPGSFTISGALSGTASLFSSTPWTSGDLDTYLGISASPTNPIGAFLPATLTFQPGADGYYVFTANLGTTTLLGTSGVGQPGQDAYLMTLGQDLAAGGYIIGFLEQSGKYGATANSGAILETSSVPEPATWAMMLVGFGAAGVALRRRRKTAVRISQLA